MSKVLHPTAMLCAVLFGSSLMLSTMAMADSSSEAMQEQRSVLEDQTSKSVQTDVVVVEEDAVLLEDDGSIVEESEVIVGREPEVTGQLPGDPELLDEGDSAALKEHREAITQDKQE